MTVLDHPSVNPNALGNWRVQIEHLRRGDRWCVSCGTVCIPKYEPSYVVKCSNCYRAFRDTAGKGKTIRVLDKSKQQWANREIQVSAYGMAKYCRHCGTDITEDGEGRLNYALRQSGGERECLTCYCCNKGVKKPTHGVLIPDHWLPFEEQLFPKDSIPSPSPTLHV